MDKSLDEVIAERKIAKSSNGVSRGGGGDRLDKSLSAVIADRKVITNLNGVSRRSDMSLDKSLDEVIAERKIASPTGVASVGVSNTNNGSTTGGGRRRPISKVEEDQEGDEEMGQLKKKMKRDEDDDDDFLMTPLEAVDILTTKNRYIIEHEIVKQTEADIGRDHNWRASIRCGEVVVVCDAPFKNLAKQAAAFELVKIITNISTDGIGIGIEKEEIFPRCKIPEGCFYDNAVVDKLDAVTDSLGLDCPRYETEITRRHRRDFYITTYFVGEDEFKGQSCFENHSRMLGAKAAWETYTQKKFPRETYKVETMGVEEGKVYKFHESEAVHALSIVRPQTNEIFY